MTESGRAVVRGFGRRPGAAGSNTDRRVRRFRPHLVWACVAVAAAGLGWWAATVTFAPTNWSSAQPKQSESLVATEGVLGREIRVPVYADWVPQFRARAGFSGTVTSIDLGTGEPVEVGTQLLSIDLRPVSLAIGDVPSFRELSVGAEGKDVAQLQDFLRTIGEFYGDSTGVFGYDTHDAVTRWQASRGGPVDGVVQPSDLLFVPSFPAHVALADDIKIGALIAQGADVVLVLSEQPRFTARFEPEQASMVSEGTPIRIVTQQANWTGQLQANTTSESDNTISAMVTSADGGAICGQECVDQVPVPRGSDKVAFRANVTIVPETKGVLVPVGSVITSASGATQVVTPAGKRLDVEVLLTADGYAALTGIRPGTRVLLNPTEDAQSSQRKE